MKLNRIFNLSSFGRNLTFFVVILTLFFVTGTIYYRSEFDCDYRIYYRLLRDAPNQENCSLPRIDPYDPTIREYLSNPQSTVSSLICKKMQADLTHLDGSGVLHVNYTETLNYGSVKCYFRCFNREQNFDDNTLKYGDWVQFKWTAEPKCEFVQVHCFRAYLPGIPIYVNLHNQIIVKNRRDNRKEKQKRPSVLLFVVDSVSKANWVRNLPETLKVLIDEYQAYVFEGFTKVGDNSFPNAVAFLTGKRVMTAGYDDELPSDMSNKYFDDWPIIWKDFSQNGYATFYAEDCPPFNLFTYLAKGFSKQPTDHYFRPYWLQLYGSLLHARSTHLCYGNSPSYSLQLNYLKEFFDKYEKDEPKFALNWLTELGHDWLQQVALGDAELARFFRSEVDNLAESFVFVLSDHGHRFDPIRRSVIGRIEEMMPFFSLHVPDRFRQRLHPVLVKNKKVLHSYSEELQQLTSFWDLYATLRDILNDGGKDVNHRRGLSLLKPIPEGRNCAQADIPEEFCVCQKETSISVTDPRVQRAGAILVTHMNNLMSEHWSRCAPLQLDGILSAQIGLPNVGMLSSSSRFVSGSNGLFVNYRIALRTRPNDGVFEALLKNAIRENTFSVIGDVSRINRYGNQSWCMHNAEMRKFCYCAKSKD